MEKKKWDLPVSLRALWFCFQGIKNSIEATWNSGNQVIHSFFFFNECSPPSILRHIKYTIFQKGIGLWKQICGFHFTLLTLNVLGADAHECLWPTLQFTIFVQNPFQWFLKAGTVHHFPSTWWFFFLPALVFSLEYFEKENVYLFTSHVLGALLWDEV